MTALALPLALLLAPAVPTEDGAAHPARLEMRPVEIPLRGGGTRTAWRGMLRVPVVRANPESKEIGVDVWRFPADDDAPEGSPPLFRLHGGPGWPGLEPEDVQWDGLAPLLRHGDVVVVGQRGIGTSEPNTSCDAFAAPLDRSVPIEERAMALAMQCAACREHWEAQGYDLTGFNVIEAAADVDDVRRLLGYEKIAIMGGSFGSHWGMAVMRFHPESVARALLHGMEGPDHTYDSPSGILGALERIAAAAESSPALAGRLPEEGLIEALRKVVRDVAEHPFEVDTVGGPVRLDGEALRGLALGYTARVHSRRTVGGWPADVVRLYRGDFEAAATALARMEQEQGGLPTASFFQLDCGSGITAERLERYTNDPALELVADPSWFYRAACAAWDADLGDEFRGGFTTNVPTLVVQGTWDVSTPFDNALELLPCFTDLHFVPVEGGTHGALDEAIAGDPAFGEAVRAFLFRGETEGLPTSVELPPIAWNAHF